MAFHIPKYILKRMFPKENAFALVRKDEGKPLTEPNYIMIKSINLMQPIEIAYFPELGGFNIDNLKDIINVKIDGSPLPMTPERVKNDIGMYHKGIFYSYAYFETLLKNTNQPFTVSLGDTVTLLVRIRDDLKQICKLGNHNFKVNINLSGFTIDLDIPLELTPENMDRKFNPSEV